jgi:crotonobetainyl-CoA:carnitine CoA-transferase CaiB-like acyl-CoA transferase
MDRGWRVANNDMVDVIFGAWTRRHTKTGALSKLDAADIPGAPVNGVADILKSSRLMSRGMLQPLGSPLLQDVSAVLAPGFLIKFSGADTEYRPAAMPRANNEEIFSGLLQLSLSEIEALERAGVIWVMFPIRSHSALRACQMRTVDATAALELCQT